VGTCFLAAEKKGGKIIAGNLWRENSEYCCAQARFSEPVFLLFEEKGGKLMAGN
jgi:hypothetical protein